MKVLMISTDRNILNPVSASAKRMMAYSSFLEELHIVVFAVAGTNTKKADILQLTNKIYVYPTGSLNRFLYVMDAYKIAKGILSKAHRQGRASLSELKAAYEDPEHNTSTSWVLTCQDPFETGLVGAFLRKSFAVRLQIQIHTDFLSPFFMQGALLNRVRVLVSRYVIPKADCIRVVSNRVLNSLLENGRYRLGCTPTVVPIYVDKDKFEEPIDPKRVESIRERYSHHDFIVLCSGRLSREKNLSMALRAFRDVLRENPRALLLIVGGGPEESNIINSALRFGISDNVVIEPWQEDMRPYYLAANLYLLTSNYEGYSMSLVEAAATGTPLVSTDVGLASSLVMDEGSGFLCPVGDSDCVSTAINRVIGDVELRRAFKLAAKKAAYQHLASKEDYLNKIKELWQTC